MNDFRQQCASCMRVNEDPAARRCPACGSSRLVVLAGKRTAAIPTAAAPATVPKVEGPAPPIVLKLEPQPEPVVRTKEPPAKARTAAERRRDPRAGRRGKRRRPEPIPATAKRADIAGRKGGLATQASRRGRERSEALAAALKARAHPTESTHRPVSTFGPDRSLARLIYDALLVSGSPHIRRLPDGALTAPVEVAIAALQRTLC